MIKRTPPSPDKLTKLAGSLSELFSSDPFCLLDAQASGFRKENVDCVVKRLKDRQLQPNSRDSIRKTPLLFSAMSLPLEQKIELICTILQLGGDPMISARSEVPNCTFLHGTLTPETYNKSLVQFILSYGFDQNVFHAIVKQSAKNGCMPGKPSVLSDKDTLIDPVYSEVASEIKQAMALWNHGNSKEEFIEAKELFARVADKLAELAACELYDPIRNDYQMRAAHCQEKIAECNQRLTSEGGQIKPQETVSSLCLLSM